MRRSIICASFGLLLSFVPFFTSAATCPNLYRNISYGSQGQDVVALQNFLIERGHLAAGNNTGYFSNLTRTAVRQFQCNQNIVCSGTEATTGWGSVRLETRTMIAQVCGATVAATATSASVSAQYPTMPNPTQTVSINSFNAYSAMPVIFNGSPRLYFGGWYQSTDLPHDSIYVADCPFGAGACTNVRKVLQPSVAGLYQINDPSIVLMPGGYYIMYMTGATNATLSSNAIYYSTSWANDGINWSRPTLVLPGYWLPSATIKNGRVELWANSITNGRIAKFDLGTGGTQPSAPTYASFDNVGIPPYYSNVDVQWRPSLAVYQMVSERALGTAPGDRSVIDYLTSTDGVSWHLQYPAIISPAAGQFRVGTPAQWPSSAGWLYFGSTAQQNSTSFKIRFAKWNLPN